jgi:hypothetical protein
MDDWKQRLEEARARFVKAVLSRLEKPDGHCKDCWESDAADLAAAVYDLDELDPDAFEQKVKDACDDMVSRREWCWCNVDDGWRPDAED